jgi:hypothetical protein
MPMRLPPILAAFAGLLQRVMIAWRHRDSRTRTARVRQSVCPCASTAAPAAITAAEKSQLHRVFHRHDFTRRDHGTMHLTY